MRTTRIPGLARLIALLALAAIGGKFSAAQTTISGRVVDPQGKAVVGATVKVVLPGGSTVTESRTDDIGQFSISRVSAGEYRLVASAPGFAAIAKDGSFPGAAAIGVDLQFDHLESQSQSILITSKSVEPAIDHSKSSSSPAHSRPHSHESTEPLAIR